GARNDEERADRVRRDCITRRVAYADAQCRAGEIFAELGIVRVAEVLHEMDDAKRVRPGREQSPVLAVNEDEVTVAPVGRIDDAIVRQVPPQIAVEMPGAGREPDPGVETRIGERVKEVVAKRDVSTGRTPEVPNEEKAFHARGPALLRFREVF